MDTIYRYLPIVVVLSFALMVSNFQVNAQSYQNPIQYEYPTGNIVNDNYSKTGVIPKNSSFQVNPFWVLMTLLIFAIPAVYFVWRKMIEYSDNREPAGRGYQIAYQDIRRLKKRSFSKRVPRRKITG